MPKNLNLKIFLVAIITITSSVKAEDPEMVRLGQASGGYIGVGFMLTALKRSECGYAYKETPLGGQARFQELMGLVNRNTQETIKRELSPSQLSSIENDANNVVKDQIALTKKSYDKNTACGLVVGMLVGAALKQEDNWRTFLRSGSRLLK